MTERRQDGPKPGDLSEGIGRLLVGLIETLRLVMETQAVRRFEAGDLTPDEERRLSTALQALSEKMPELRKLFDLDPDREVALSLGEIEGTALDLREALESLIETGLVVRGDAQLGLADVALAELELSLHLRAAGSNPRRKRDPEIEPPS